VSLALPPREIRIRRPALDKLLLYAARCPVEIGGLGTLVEEAGGLLITDLFLLPQKVSAWDTELDPEALFDLLGRLVAEGRDVAGVRVWWHSHADLDLVWSETDAATIANLPGDFWVALVANRRGEVACRLDAFTPRRQTWDLPLVEVLDGGGGDPEQVRASIDREILEKVRAYTVVQEVIGSEGVAPTVREYPVPLRLEPPPTPREQGEAGEGK
jgi:proteasome lid subunit RPN8/RPN11